MLSHDQQEAHGCAAGGAGAVLLGPPLDALAVEDMAAVIQQDLPADATDRIDLKPHSPNVQQPERLLAAQDLCADAADLVTACRLPVDTTGRAWSILDTQMLPLLLSRLLLGLLG